MGNFGFHSLEQSGGDNDSVRHSSALNDFRTARRRAALQAVLGRLRGGSLELLSYEEVTGQLHVVGQIDRGVHEIPLDKIVGSVGRYDEFDRSFLPLKDHDAQRWASVRSAANNPGDLPPIEVYQIGDAYFVIDGNHRVSIAHQTGANFLDAHVIEIRTRVPLPSDLQHDELILASEQVAFLEHTHLDKLRPEVALAVSLPGQYARLENHIEVHRFFVEMSEERELTDEEAVLLWYDETYLPVVDAIREQGLLRGFDGRTETDLYLWIAENQSALRNELGWEIGAQTAVEQFAPYLDAAGSGRFGRLYRKVIHAVIPDRGKDGEMWSRKKTLARYSDRLFAVILVAVEPNLFGPALDKALDIARLEQAHLLAIQTTGDQNDLGEQLLQTRERFAEKIGDAGLSGEIGFEKGGLAEVVQARIGLADLLVLDKELLNKEISDVQTIVEKCARPLLIASQTPRPTRRVLLLCDDSKEAQEALFMAAYMAEMWGCRIVLYAGADTSAEPVDHASAYLAMHEVATGEIVTGPLAPEAVFEAAVVHRCDIVVVGSDKKQPLGKTVLAASYLNFTGGFDFSILISP